MGSRVRRPDTDTLPISGGDTLTVKRFLTAAEFREVVRASTKPIRINGGTSGDLSMEVDPTESGVATVLAYLLDWTFTDYDGKPLVIRDQPPKVVRAALDAIDAESYMEVQRAIQAHDTAVKQFEAAEKKNEQWVADARTDLTICKVMGWTLPEVWDLPMIYYEFLVAELTEAAAEAARR